MSEHLKKKIKRVQLVLNYREPFKISVIGASGSGKSILLNSLLGRKDLLPSGQGGTKTGTELMISLDAPTETDEGIILVYHNAKSIHELIKNELVEGFSLESLDLPDRKEKTQRKIAHVAS